MEHEARRKVWAMLHATSPEEMEEIANAETVDEAITDDKIEAMMQARAQLGRPQPPAEG